MNKTKKLNGFTFIEILILVVIVGILATVILLSIGQYRKNARLNSVKTSIKTAFPIIISCNDSKGAINFPNGQENGTRQICNLIFNAFWPTLPNGYAYINGGNYTEVCNFRISTNTDVTAKGNTELTCNCINQVCE